MITNRFLQRVRYDGQLNDMKILGILCNRCCRKQGE